MNPSTTPHRPRRWTRALGLLIALALAGGLGYAGWRWRTAEVPKGRGEGAQPVRVVAQAARRGDLPEYLNALGTVTSVATVTVRTRVDGQIVKVDFHEGTLVKEGDLLAQIDPRSFEVQLAQAKAQLEKDKAMLGNAKLDLKRYQDAEDAVPRQQVDTAAALVAQLEAALQVDQSQIDNAQLQLTYCRITAPVSGRAGLRQVDEGNIIHASDAGGLVVIAATQPITVVFSIQQDELQRVLKGQAQQPLVAEAYDRDLTAKLATGNLAAVDSQIDPTTGTCRMKAEFDNKDGSLFPNQFVNIRLLVNTEHGVVLAPVAAVQKGPQGAFVFVVTGDGTVEVRPVTQGVAEGDSTVITKGLSEGETVVTDGTDKLRAGTKVALSDDRNGAPAQGPRASSGNRNNRAPGKGKGGG